MTFFDIIKCSVNERWQGFSTHVENLLKDICLTYWFSLYFCASKFWGKLYLKNTYYLDFFIVIQTEDESLKDDIRIKMSSIKYDLEKENIDVDIYVFTSADISSLSEDDIKSMNIEDALVYLK